MNYRIGLDIGIASVGWSVIENNADDEPMRIVDLGVRTFKPAENPKDGTSLAVDRRNARGLRRRLRRKADRIYQAKKFLQDELLNGRVDSNINRDIFELRNRALDKLISNEELYSVILYFVKHRGFKSNRKSESKQEGGTLLKSIEANNVYLESKDYRTIGELIFNDEKYYTINASGKKEYKIRNHPVAQNSSYENCFARKDLEKELLVILDSQSKLGNTKITREFISTILNIFNKQRSFDEGPNEPSPYKANFAVGMDIFEKEEFRAPKGSFTFEYFNALQKLNNLTILYEGNKRNLSSNEIAIFANMLLMGKELKYSTIRKELDLPIDASFGGLTYYVKKKTNEEKLTREQLVAECEKKSYVFLKFTKELSKALDINISKDNADLFDAIGLILSMRKSDDARKNAFGGNDDILSRLTSKQVEALKSLTNAQIEKLLELDPVKFGNLSFKSMQKIIPYLEQGNTYDKACGLAGYDFNKAYGGGRKVKITWADLQDDLQEITSPVVLRSLSQTIKVVNAIIEKYGSPVAIFVEVAREMSKNFKERKSIEKEMENRHADNERYKERLKAMGITPSAQDIVKFRLYEEQGGKCAYSGKSFVDVLGDMSNVFSNNNTQIDHIMPYSKSFDDSYNNKVLVLASENQKKGNRLPYEYMSAEQFSNFEAFVQTTYADKPRKVQNLLRKHINEEERKELNNRALNDTKHVSKFVLNMLNNHLLFNDSKYSKKPVRAVNGAMTSYLRKVWGLTKVRFENDRHHAMDASVVACCTNRMINDVSRWLQYRDKNKDNKLLESLPTEVINGVKCYIDPDGVVIPENEFDVNVVFGPHIPQPYDYYSKELEARLSHNPTSHENIKTYIDCGYTTEQLGDIKELFVSRMPTRGVKGPIHAQTLRRVKQYSSGKKVLVTKTNLTDLKLKNGEIEGYSEQNKNSDPRLYKAILDRLIQFDGDAKKAFAEPLYKPKADGTNGPVVNKVKIESVATDYVDLHNKTAAEKSSMVRIDVFEKNNKNYFIPVYVSDVYKGVLPNKVVSLGKSGWLELDDSYSFRFSLYPNDLIYVESKDSLKGTKVLTGEKVLCKSSFGYYVKSGISNAAIVFDSPDSEIEFVNIGIQNLQKIEKYCVDVLGHISKVKHETRMPLKLKR